MLLVKTFPLYFIFRCAETYLINQSCTTPLDEESHCVSIDKCAPMINFLNSIEKPVAAGIKNGLRKFVCTFEDQPSNTSICCPSGPFSIDKEGIIMGPKPHKNQKYLPKDCGTVNPTAKILNGRNTELFEFPSMAALFYRKDGTLVSKCGGSILSEKYILTAASCLHNTNLEFAGVKVGLNSLSSQSNCTIEDPKYCFPIVQYLLPEKIIKHSEYDVSSLVNDIALIRVPNINLVPGAQTGCTTPDSKSGQCLAIGKCPTMIDFLNKSPKPFSNEVKDLLNKYVCTYENEAINTQICCPSDPIDINGKDNEEAPPPPPPDVLSHENLKLLPEECGSINSDSKIRGGKDARLREFPWMALLAYTTDEGPKFKCGGSVINEKYILTAAHCVVKTPYPLVSVRVGEYSILSEKDCEEKDLKDCLPPPQNVAVEKTVVHPDYSTKSYANDIALLRVGKVNLESGGVQTVCLPVYKEVITQDYSNGIVTGWGFTDPYGINTVDRLQKVSLKRRNLTVCIDAYSIEKQIKLSYKQICVGGEGIKDSCGGDSGGPFHVPYHFNDDDRYVQHGVVSIGHRFCGTEGFPGIYTKVAYYAKWILDNIEP